MRPGISHTRIDKRHQLSLKGYQDTIEERAWDDQVFTIAEDKAMGSLVEREVDGMLHLLFDQYFDQSVEGSEPRDYEVLCFLRDCGLFSLAFPVWDAVDTVGGLLADHNGDFTFEAFASLLGKISQDCFSELSESEAFSRLVSEHILPLASREEERAWLVPSQVLFYEPVIRTLQSHVPLLHSLFTSFSLDASTLSECLSVASDHILPTANYILVRTRPSLSWEGLDTLMTRTRMYPSAIQDQSILKQLFTRLAYEFTPTVHDAGIEGNTPMLPFQGWLELLLILSFQASSSPTSHSGDESEFSPEDGVSHLLDVVEESLLDHWFEWCMEASHSLSSYPPSTHPPDPQTRNGDRVCSSHAFFLMLHHTHTLNDWMGYEEGYLTVSDERVRDMGGVSEMGEWIDRNTFEFLIRSLACQRSSEWVSVSSSVSETRGERERVMESAWVDMLSVLMMSIHTPRFNPSQSMHTLALAVLTHPMTLEMMCEVFGWMRKEFLSLSGKVVPTSAHTSTHSSKRHTGEGSHVITRDAFYEYCIRSNLTQTETRVCASVDTLASDSSADSNQAFIDLPKFVECVFCVAVSDGCEGCLYNGLRECGDWDEVVASAVTSTISPMHQVSPHPVEASKGYVPSSPETIQSQASLRRGDEDCELLYQLLTHRGEGVVEGVEESALLIVLRRCGWIGNLLTSWKARDVIRSVSVRVGVSTNPPSTTQQPQPSIYIVPDPQSLERVFDGVGSCVGESRAVVVRECVKSVNEWTGGVFEGGDSVDTSYFTPSLLACTHPLILDTLSSNQVILKAVYATLVYASTVQGITDPSAPSLLPPSIPAWEVVESADMGVRVDVLVNISVEWGIASCVSEAIERMSWVLHTSRSRRGAKEWREQTLSIEDMVEYLIACMMSDVEASGGDVGDASVSVNAQPSESRARSHTLSHPLPVPPTLTSPPPSTLVKMVRQTLSHIRDQTVFYALETSSAPPIHTSGGLCIESVDAALTAMFSDDAKIGFVHEGHSRIVYETLSPPELVDDGEAGEMGVPTVRDVEWFVWLARSCPTDVMGAMDMVDVFESVCGEGGVMTFRRFHQCLEAIATKHSSKERISQSEAFAKLMRHHLLPAVLLSTQISLFSVTNAPMDASTHSCITYHDLKLLKLHLSTLRIIFKRYSNEVCGASNVSFTSSVCVSESSGTSITLSQFELFVADFRLVGEGKLGHEGVVRLFHSHTTKSWPINSHSSTQPVRGECGFSTFCDILLDLAEQLKTAHMSSTQSPAQTCSQQPAAVEVLFGVMDPSKTIFRPPRVMSHHPLADTHTPSGGVWSEEVRDLPDGAFLHTLSTELEAILPAFEGLTVKADMAEVLYTVFATYCSGSDTPDPGVITLRALVTLLSHSHVLHTPIHLHTLVTLFNEASTSTHSPSVGPSHLSFKEFVPLMSRVASVWMRERTATSLIHPQTEGSTHAQMSDLDVLMSDCIAPHAATAAPSISSQSNGVLEHVANSPELMASLANASDFISSVFDRLNQQYGVVTAQSVEELLRRAQVIPGLLSEADSRSVMREILSITATHPHSHPSTHLHALASIQLAQFECFLCGCACRMFNELLEEAIKQHTESSTNSIQTTDASLAHHALSISSLSAAHLPFNHIPPSPAESATTLFSQPATQLPNAPLPLRNTYPTPPPPHSSTHQPPRAHQPHERRAHQKRFPLSAQAVRMIRHRWAAASYTNEGQDWQVSPLRSDQTDPMIECLKELFRRQDRHRTDLDSEGVRVMFRRILKIPPSEITDRDIKLLVSALDTSGQGILQPDELLEFINSDDDPHRATRSRMRASRRGSRERSNTSNPNSTSHPRPQSHPSTSARSHPFTLSHPPKQSHSLPGMDGKRGELGMDAVTFIRHRWAAATYTPEGQDWRLLFEHMDKDHSHTLEIEEFTHMFRSVLKIPGESMDDTQIETFFHSLDANHDGRLSYAEVHAFLSSGVERFPPRGYYVPVITLPHKTEATVSNDALTLIRHKWAAATYTPEGQDWRLLFEHMDKDHSHTLEIEEFTHMFRSVLKIPRESIDDAQIVSFFNSLDANHDGKLSYSEVHAFLQNGEQSITSQVPPPYSTSKPTHKGVSEDVLTLIRHRWAAATYTPEGQDWRLLFKHMDKDHSHTLEIEEFTHMIRSVLKIPRESIADAQIVSFFNSLDVNHDGKLSYSEVHAFLQNGEEELQHTTHIPPRPSPKVDKGGSSTSNPLTLIRHRWAAATYTPEGQDWRLLFEHMDKDHSHTLSLGEVIHMFRSVLKITPQQITDVQVMRFFNDLDKNHDNELSYAEVYAFLNDSSNESTSEPPPPQLATSNPNPTPPTDTPSRESLYESFLWDPSTIGTVGKHRAAMEQLYCKFAGETGLSIPQLKALLSSLGLVHLQRDVSEFLEVDLDAGPGTRRLSFVDYQELMCILALKHKGVDLASEDQATQLRALDSFLSRALA